jgi:hypothetical protein
MAGRSASFGNRGGRGGREQGPGVPLPGFALSGVRVPGARVSRVATAALAGMLVGGLVLASPPGAAAQEPDLSPEHRRIAFLVGEWRTTSEFPDGRVGEGELSYRWVLDGSWMKVEFLGDHPAGTPWAAQVMQRWNPDQGAYESWVFGGSGPPLHYRGESDGPGHFRVTYAPEAGPVTGIDYHHQDDGTVLQENWMDDGGDRHIMLRTRYRPFRPPPPPPIPGVVPAGDSAGVAATPEEAEVLAVLDRLFHGMRMRDASILEELFHPEARMLVAPPGGNDPVPVPVRSAESFIASVGAGGEPLHEPYFNPEVRIDGHLAHVWTFYHLYRGDTFGHCGHDSFELVRTPEGWKLVFLAYTVRTGGCEAG